MITVFTPTFNRVGLLGRLYESLLQQSDFDFEWVVVDDGSTDGTENFFDTIQKNTNPFDIEYVRQSNGGKHRAINKGVAMASGELFFIVDSDDYLTEDAIEKIKKWVDGLDDAHKWGGVAGAKGYNINSHIGGVGKGEDFVDAKNTEREAKGLTGDKAEVYFTDVLKKYPFPEFDGENFLTEEVVWNEIAYNGFYLRWFPDIIYICEYLDGGLTKTGNKKYKSNPNGVLYWAKQRLKIFKNFKKRAGAVNTYYEAVKDKKSLKEISNDLCISKAYCRFANFAAKIKNMFSSKKGS